MLSIPEVAQHERYAKQKGHGAFQARLCGGVPQPCVVYKGYALSKHRKGHCLRQLRRQGFRTRWNTVQGRLRRHRWRHYAQRRPVLRAEHQGRIRPRRSLRHRNEVRRYNRGQGVRAESAQKRRRAERGRRSARCAEASHDHAVRHRRLRKAHSRRDRQPQRALPRLLYEVGRRRIRL